MSDYDQGKRKVSVSFVDPTPDASDAPTKGWLSTAASMFPSMPWSGSAAGPTQVSQNSSYGGDEVRNTVNVIDETHRHEHLHEYDNSDYNGCTIYNMPQEQSAKATQELYSQQSKTYGASLKGFLFGGLSSSHDTTWSRVAGGTLATDQRHAIHAQLPRPRLY